MHFSLLLGAATTIQVVSAGVAPNYFRPRARLNLFTDPACSTAATPPHKELYFSQDNKCHSFAQAQSGHLVWHSHQANYQTCFVQLFSNDDCSGVQTTEQHYSLKRQPCIPAQGNASWESAQLTCHYPCDGGDC